MHALVYEAAAGVTPQAPSIFDSLDAMVICIIAVSAVVLVTFLASYRLVGREIEERTEQEFREAEMLSRRD